MKWEDGMVVIPCQTGKRFEIVHILLISHISPTSSKYESEWYWVSRKVWCTGVCTLGAVCTMIWSMVCICSAPSSTAVSSEEDFVWSATDTNILYQWLREEHDWTNIRKLRKKIYRDIWGKTWTLIGAKMSNWEVFWLIVTIMKRDPVGFWSSYLHRACNSAEKLMHRNPCNE